MQQRRKPGQQRIEVSIMLAARLSRRHRVCAPARQTITPVDAQFAGRPLRRAWPGRHRQFADIAQHGVARAQLRRQHARMQLESGWRCKVSSAPARRRRAVCAERPRAGKLAQSSPPPTRQGNRQADRRQGVARHMLARRGNLPRQSAPSGVARVSATRSLLQLAIGDAPRPATSQSRSGGRRQPVCHRPA